MKTLNSWMEETFTESEREEITAEAEREARAIDRARHLARKLIDQIMVEQGIGFNEFARKARVSPSHLSAIMSGKSSPSLSTLTRIAASFGKGVEVSVV